MSVTIYRYGIKMEFPQYTFDKMLEYCQQVYKWDKDDLIRVICLEGVNIQKIESKLSDNEIIPCHGEYYLVKDVIDNLSSSGHRQHQICPILIDNETGKLCTITALKEVSI